MLMAASPGDAPVVLVGHSMGGMTIMALARMHPELFGTKVIGAVLISTASCGVDPAVWLPALMRPLARQTAPPCSAASTSGRVSGVVERVRQAGGELAFLGTRYVAFGDPSVSPAVVDFLEHIIRATPVAVVAEFYLALLTMTSGPRWCPRPGAGDRDHRGTRPAGPAGDKARSWPRQIPGAELVRVAGAGHVVILERPDFVNSVISALLERTVAGTSRRGRSA